MYQVSSPALARRRILPDDHWGDARRRIALPVASSTAAINATHSDHRSDTSSAGSAISDTITSTTPRASHTVARGDRG